MTSPTDGHTEGDPEEPPEDNQVEVGADPSANDDPTGPAEDDDAEAAATDEPIGDDWKDLPPPPLGLNDNLADYEAELFAEGGTGFGGLSSVATERDEYRDALMRVKADFDNYRKRVAKEHATTVERAAEKLVADVLPVLDACEAAIGHGSEDVEPIFKSLVDILEKSGLQRMQTDGQPFDPNLHEAVLHEPGDDDETIVVESLRSGYLWNGRVVRPAMVKVKG